MQADYREERKKNVSPREALSRAINKSDAKRSAFCDGSYDFENGACDGKWWDWVGEDAAPAKFAEKPKWTDQERAEIREFADPAKLLPVKDWTPVEQQQRAAYAKEEEGKLEAQRERNRVTILRNVRLEAQKNDLKNQIEDLKGEGRVSEINVRSATQEVDELKEQLRVSENRVRSATQELDSILEIIKEEPHPRKAELQAEIDEVRANASAFREALPSAVLHGFDTAEA